jgi:catalase
VTALRFINGSGEGKFGRFRVRPEGGADYLRDASEKAPNYLVDEITERVATGPVKLHIVVQVAVPGDVTDDATVHWPEDRTNVPFGMVTLTGRIPNDDADAKRIIFDPIPRVDGVEPSGDPLLAVRANIYLRSGRRRRAGDPSM